MQDYGLRGCARRYYPVQVGYQTAVVPAGRVPVGAPTKLRLRGERNHVPHPQPDRNQSDADGQRLGGHDAGYASSLS